MASDTVTWTYAYNADGLWTSRSNGTDTYTYVYNGSSLSQMTVGENTLRFTYDASGLARTVTWNGTVYYYATNLQGDIIAILDADGNAVVEYIYDAWGNIHSTSGTLSATLGTLNPLRYRGYVYDTETKLYYLQSRYYNPEIGRFINADSFVSTGQGFIGNNMFAYCLNNPVNYYDPTGSITLEAIVCVLYEVAIVACCVVLTYCAVKIVTLSVEWVIQETEKLFRPFPETHKDVYSEELLEVPPITDTVSPEAPSNTASINQAKTKGRENVRDTGLANESDAEVQRKAHDAKLPSSVRQRYKTEEKARGLRNVQKRNMKQPKRTGGFHLGGS